MSAALLSARFHPHFSKGVRERGLRHQRGGRVRRCAPTEFGLVASISGARGYEVVIPWESADSVGFCSCEAYSMYGPCEHMWAALLEADALGFELPARVEPPRPARTLAPEPPEWRLRLERLARVRSVERPDPWAGLEDDDARIGYQLVRTRSYGEEEVCVRTVRRKRLKSGALGEPRDVVIGRVDDDELVDPDDRALFAMLGRDEQGGGRTERQFGSSARHFLGPELAREVLPRMARTGRLELEGPHGRIVGWDDGGEWSFVLELSGASAGEARVIDGGLVRGDERVELGDVVLLVPAGLFVAGGMLARFDAGGELAWMIELLRGGPIEVPAGDEAELRELLARLPAAAWSADELLPELGAPRPRLAVAPGPGAEAACAVSFDYGAGEPVAPERASLVVETPDGARRRDLEAERRYLAEFIEAGGKRARGQRAEGAHGTVNAGRLPELARALVASGWLVEAEGRRMRRAGATSVSVKSGVDWFELDGEVAFGDQTARFPELLRAVRDGTQRVQLGDGSIGLLPEDWLASWGLVEFADDAGDGRLLFRGNQGWLLDALLAEREGVECDARFAAYRERLASFRGVRPQREPRGFVGELRPYQRDGLGWFRFLRELGLGGCLADDMGLGKTVQVLALLEERRAEGGRRPSLVVAPRSLVFNWIDEAARFTPRLRVLDYTGTDRAARRAQAGEVDLLVTTYGTLRRDAVQLADEEFDYVVLDEATAIKNAASQSAKASRLLRAEHRLALTGTPIENHLGELWSLFEFLNPGMLGRSKAFQRLTTPGEGGSGLGALARALRPFFLRRTKDEVLQDLPPKTEQIVLCELGRAERKRYDELRAHYRAVLLQGSAADESLGRMKIQVLEALLRLRQAACHPGLVDPARRGDGSAKLDALLPLLEELVSEGHKALVFSQFTSLLAIVRARLDAAGIVHEYLDGRTRDRKERVARFQSDPACPLFLISLKAGGHGLNLTASDYVFLLDPWWNPAVESQAIDRAHRIGQSRSVFAYRLIAKDTVEQRVLELQERKRELAEALLGQGPRVLKDLTRDDLEALLS